MDASGESSVSTGAGEPAQPSACTVRWLLEQTNHRPGGRGGEREGEREGDREGEREGGREGVSYHGYSAWAAVSHPLG